MPATADAQVAPRIAQRFTFVVRHRDHASGGDSFQSVEDARAWRDERNGLRMDRPYIIFLRVTIEEPFE